MSDTPVPSLASAAQLKPAAQYLRMSTEHQRYSLDSQARAIAAYAQSNGLDVVQTYVDAGVSGLTLEPREGLKRLLADVLDGQTAYRVVLVFDVSRWGRFQDPDEAAHYEFLCRSCGVSVTYCAEAFADDMSLASTLLKQVKRAMAAEYLRELSAKVSRAQKGVALQGFWRGGAAPYGFRRQMVRFDGAEGQTMERGERKALQGHRTRLVAASDDETRVVRRIFHDYAVRRRGGVEISRNLNSEGVPGPGGRTWAAWTVRQMLRNEAYVGVIVISKRRVVMRKVLAQPKQDWVRVRDACPRLVSGRLFARATARLAEYHSARDVSDEVLLDQLRAILREHGRINMNLIRDTPGAHSTEVIRRRFGSMIEAYERAGATLSFGQIAAKERRAANRNRRAWRHTLSDEELIARLRDLLDREGRLTASLIDEDPSLPSATTCHERLGPATRLYGLVGYVPSPRQRHLIEAAQRRRKA